MDDQRLNRIEVKVDKVLERQAEMNTTLAAQHASLDEHMRRTANLEERIVPLEVASIEDKAVKGRDYIWWGTIIALIGAFEGVHALLNWLGGSS